MTPSRLAGASPLADARSGTRFRFTLYPYGDRTDILPDAAALDREAGAVPAAGPDGDGWHRLLPLPRSMGEWKMAGEAAGSRAGATAW